MSEINHISDDSFQSDVLQADKPVLVDFTAVWCGPCKMLDPVVKQLAQEWAGKVKFVMVDVDSNPNVTMNYQVMGVPTLMMFVNGRPVERVSGYQPKDRLVNQFSPHINYAEGCRFFWIRRGGSPDLGVSGCVRTRSPPNLGIITEEPKEPGCMKRQWNVTDDVINRSGT